MPGVQPYWFTSLRRGAVGFGRFLRPAVRPAAYGAAGLGVGVLAFRGIEGAIDAYGRVRNPPFQTGTVDTDGQPGADSAWVADPRTGRVLVFGTPPTDKGDNERSEERMTKGALLAGVAIVGAVAAVLIFRK